MSLCRHAMSRVADVSPTEVTSKSSARLLQSGNDAVSPPLLSRLRHNSLRRDQPGNMRRPQIQRRSLFVGPIMPLVDADDPGLAAADMVQDRFRHFEPNAELLQPGRDSAAQIVQAPACNLRPALTRNFIRRRVEAQLGFL